MRLRRAGLFFACAVLVSATAAAQTPLEDGARALVRGDYRTAAAMLRPLAEGADADPAAQFLMGILYWSGRGVDANHASACSLFSDAATSTHVLAQPAMELADAMREQAGRGSMLFCAGGPPPRFTHASFALGPGHRIDIADSDVVVTYNGAEKRVAMGLLPGWVPLPWRYTPVDVTRPAPGRRHFLQMYAWWRNPQDSPSVWRLGWLLGEAVDGDFVTVKMDPSLTTATGARPPMAVDVDSLARVLVNAAGDVEWNIGSGDALRRGIVPMRDPK